MANTIDRNTIDPGLAQDIAVANHILFDQGVVDAFGHISARDPANPEHFLLARSMAPALVTAADILRFDFDGNAVDGDTRPAYLERYIHGAIYRARPDVGSVVHSHSPAMVPFGIVSGLTLRPVCHMSGFLAGTTPVFEIRDTAGEASDMLIRNGRLGDALAHSLGNHAVVLMRGHGSTAVGTSLKQAVLRAIYAEVNARLQAQAMMLGAMALGSLTYLTDAEAEAAAATNDGQVNRAWDLWKLLAERRSSLG